MTNLLSNCCGEELKIVGGGEATMYYQCLGCGRGADPQIPKKLINLSSFVKLGNKIKRWALK